MVRNPFADRPTASERLVRALNALAADYRRELLDRSGEIADARRELLAHGRELRAARDGRLSNHREPDMVVDRDHVIDLEDAR